MFYITGVIADRSFTFRGYEFSTFLAPVTLILIWPSYKNSTCSSWRYTAYAKMNFLRQGFRKLSSDRHTYTQTDSETHTTKTITHATVPVVNMRNVKHVSCLDATVLVDMSPPNAQQMDCGKLMGIPLPVKCIWPCYDLDLWLLTVKRFSVISTHMMNIPLRTEICRVTRKVFQRSR